MLFHRRGDVLEEREREEKQISPISSRSFSLARDKEERTTSMDKSFVFASSMFTVRENLSRRRALLFFALMIDETSRCCCSSFSHGCMSFCFQLLLLMFIDHDTVRSLTKIRIKTFTLLLLLEESYSKDVIHRNRGRIDDEMTKSKAETSTGIIARTRNEELLVFSHWTRSKRRRRRRGEKWILPSAHLSRNLANAWGSSSLIILFISVSLVLSLSSSSDPPTKENRRRDKCQNTVR